MLRPILATTVAATLAIVPLSAQTSPSLDGALHGFWTAPDEASRASAAEALIAAAPSFTALWDRLRAGPTYPADVALGRRDLSRRDSAGVVYPYTLVVPQSYDPTRRYPVRIYLHGGIARPAWAPGGRWWRDYDRVSSEEWITVVPASWNAAPWWHDGQIDNLRGVMADVKREYNVDENNVHVFGISDGASGAYFHAFRASTAWASFLPLIGHPAVASNPRLVGDHQMHVINLTNRPFFIVNGGQDRLYPTVSVDPFIEFFRRAGVEVTYHPRPESGHNVQWWPEEASAMDAFIAAHPRAPHPARIRWEAERTDRLNRHHWLVIDELGPVEGDSTFEDDNTVVVGTERMGAFPRQRPSGRVDAERRGNTFEIATRYVRRLTILLAPDVVDFDEPIVVMTNGIEAFRGVVTPTVETLVAWAAADGDRTMLYGAAVTVTVRGRRGELR